MPAAEFGGTTYTSMFTFTESIDPGSISAESALDVVVSDAMVKSGDIVLVAAPPAALSGRIAVLGCHSVADGTFDLRLGNSGDDAVEDAAGTWTFLVLRR